MPSTAIAITNTNTHRQRASVTTISRHTYNASVTKIGTYNASVTKFSHTSVSTASSSSSVVICTRNTNSEKNKTKQKPPPTAILSSNAPDLRMLAPYFAGLSGTLGAPSGMPRSGIEEIHISSRLYRQVQQLFNENWRHPTRVLYVIKLWEIYPPHTVLRRFFSYKRHVEKNRGIPGGNTRRRFHGTVRECRLGNTSSSDRLCSRINCYLCGIIQSSFQLAKVGQRTNYGRFGAGIYTSATSSKANDYSSSVSSNKAMLLNEVVMGRGVKLTRSDTSLKQPPHGFDSVIGQPGGDLNYDECVVYNNDAICPTFLIIYH